jgi:hypothetical protein
VDPTHAERVEVCLDHVGHRPDRRPLGEDSGATVTGKIDSEYLVLGLERGTQGSEIVAGRTDAVEQEEGFAGSGAIPGQSRNAHPL